MMVSGTGDNDDKGHNFALRRGTDICFESSLSRRTMALKHQNDVVWCVRELVMLIQEKVVGY